MEKEFICNLKTIFKSITLNLNTYYLIPNKHFPTLGCKWSFSICLSQCCHIQPQLTTFTLVESKDKNNVPLFSLWQNFYCSKLLIDLKLLRKRKKICDRKKQKFKERRNEGYGLVSYNQSPIKLSKDRHGKQIHVYVNSYRTITMVMVLFMVRIWFNDCALKYYFRNAKTCATTRRNYIQTYMFVYMYMLLTKYCRDSKDDV